MATQGLVTLVGAEGTVLMKAVAGCNGMQGGALALAAEAAGTLSRQAFRDLAVACGFGCPDCLVVQDAEGATGPADFVPGPLWAEHFAEPRFNPRWGAGTADYVHLVEGSWESEGTDG